MAYLASFLSHHLLSLVITALSLGFSATILRQPRPTGSALAWLLVILLIPYLGIPLYLVLGGRKYAQRARSKSLLPRPPVEPGDPVASLPAVAALTRRGGPGSPVVAEHIAWLDDGVAAYDTFLRQILEAQRSIRLVTFVIGDDTTGRTLLDALTRRAREGLEVRLLIDDLLRFRAPRRELARLVEAGGRVERFMPLVHVPFRGRSNLRNHRKIAVFDGARGIVGGMNLADEYMGPGPSPGRWRDLSVLLSGPVARSLDDVFRADWEFACKERLAEQPMARGPDEGVPVLVVPSGPDSDTDPIYDAILTAIFRTERRFWVATPYFVPDEALTRALAVAARRGVDVKVVVPAASNHTLADLAAAPFLRELDAAGVNVLRYPTMLHAKAMLADDGLALVGSANFDMRSLFLDYEIALFLPGKEEVARLDRWFRGTFSAATPGIPAVGAWRGQVESVARLLAPLI